MGYEKRQTELFQSQCGDSDYIKDQLDKRERATMKAIAQVVVDEERQREGLQRRIETLEAEIAELRDRELGRRLRAVPSPPSALIA